MNNCFKDLSQSNMLTENPFFSSTDYMVDVLLKQHTGLEVVLDLRSKDR